jgi:hypothetical protein
LLFFAVSVIDDLKANDQDDRAGAFPEGQVPMESRDPEPTADDSAASIAKPAFIDSGLRPLPASVDTVVGSPEHLQSTFARAAAAAADRAVGAAVGGPGFGKPDDMLQSRESRPDGDFRALRALVRASATAYARRLRDDGATPERMVVLVKAAAGRQGVPGLSAQELTNDIVRWSIEAYFDE